MAESPRILRFPGGAPVGQNLNSEKVAILAVKLGFDRKKLVLVEVVSVDFGQKTGLRRFWPEKLGVDRKNLFWSILTEKSGFSRF